jgi:hypothetical protein
VHLLRLLRDLRQGLNRRRPGPDDPDPLAAEVDATGRPLAVWCQSPQKLSSPAKSGRFTDDRLPTAITQCRADTISPPRSNTRTRSPSARSR